MSVLERIPPDIHDWREHIDSAKFLADQTETLAAVAEARRVKNDASRVSFTRQLENMTGRKLTPQRDTVECAWEVAGDARAMSNIMRVIEEAHRAWTLTPEMRTELCGRAHVLGEKYPNGYTNGYPEAEWNALYVGAIFDAALADGGSPTTDGS